jgi:hypothetical protein
MILLEVPGSWIRCTVHNTSNNYMINNVHTKSQRLGRPKLFIQIQLCTILQLLTTVLDLLVSATECADAPHQAPRQIRQSTGQTHTAVVILRAGSSSLDFIVKVVDLMLECPRAIFVSHDRLHVLITIAHLTS